VVELFFGIRVRPTTALVDLVLGVINDFGNINSSQKRLMPEGTRARAHQTATPAN
jgi:hypothetical protein